MTRGPGRHSERNFQAAERHYNAVEYAEKGNILSVITRYRTDFTDSSGDLKPTGSLGPASQKQLVGTNTKLTNRRTSLTCVLRVIITFLFLFFMFCFMFYYYYYYYYYYIKVVNCMPTSSLRAKCEMVTVMLLESAATADAAAVANYFLFLGRMTSYLARLV